MPELPEVETVRRGLVPYVQGKCIERVQLNRAGLRYPFPFLLEEKLQNVKVLQVQRRAKYLVWLLDNGYSLILHLGMSGKFCFATQQEYTAQKHDHILWYMTEGLIVAFNDPRRFGFVDIVPTEGLAACKHLSGLGVEPTPETLTPAYLQKCFEGKTTSVKIALLDQRIIAGIGNIYASESLFHAGIAPQRSAGSLSFPEIQRLTASVLHIINLAIAAGGSSLRDYAAPSGELGCFQHQFAVYDKEGQACGFCVDAGCGVRKITQAGRSTFYCAVKQH